MANKLKKKSAGSEGGNKERRNKRQTRGDSGLGENRGKNRRKAGQPER
jgi:hypothetical protein